MKRRTMIGLAAGVAATLAVGAGAAVVGAHAGGRHAIVRRVIAATIDEALDVAGVSPEQRAAIHAARDRVFAAVEAERASRHQHVEETLALFEAEQVDRARVEALHQQGEAARQRIRTAVHEALVEAHGVLTPAQRKAVADHVRRHRLAHLQ